MRMAVRFARQLWWSDKTRVFLTKDRYQAKHSALLTAQAREFTRLAMDMGGLIIKIGQHLSTRIDMLPKEYTQELAKLLDAVPPANIEAIKSSMEQELGSPPSVAFAAFNDTPIASASLGQVHEARLHSGERVAVKVLRPGIEDIINTDLRSLRSVLTMIKRRTPMGRLFDVDVLYREFEQTFLDELDLVKEAQSIETVQRNLLTNAYVDMPKVYGNLSTRRVLTMEFMEGVKINDLAALDALGIDRHAVAVHLLEIYLQMILRDGVFHADPHPGNVFVRADGTILLVDFGMMGTVATDIRSSFTDLAAAVFAQDAEKVVAVFRDLGFLRKDAETGALVKAILPILKGAFVGGMSAGAAPVGGMSAGGAPASERKGLSRLDISEQAVDDLREFFYTQPFLFPENVTFLGKTLITVLGVCAELDPELDLMEELTPLVETYLGTDATQNVISTILGELGKLLPQLYPAVLRLISISEKVVNDDLVARLPKTQEKRIIQSQSAQSQRVVRTIIGAVLFLAGTQVFLDGAYAVLSIVMMVLGALVMALQLRVPKDERKRRFRHLNP
jgi:predicted unusual protein kinase regulating ubiquinone biosynthesis (AarF/ABC1/UbiB family)